MEDAKLFNLLLTLSILIIISYFICDVFDTTFGKSIPFAYVIITLVQYISAILGKLSYYKYLILLLCIFILLFIVFKHKNSLSSIFKNKKFFSVSLVIFILLFTYLYFALSNVYLSNIDDIGYWGSRLKDMFNYDKLYETSKYTIFGGRGYPPFTHLLEFAFLKLLGSFKEPYMIIALSSFSCSFFMPLFDRFTFKLEDILKATMQLIFIIALLLCVSLNPTNHNPSYIFNSIYVDWLLSIALMYAFYSIYHFRHDKIFDYINIGMASFVLIFTKQIGFALFILVITTLLFKLIISKEVNHKSFLHYFILCIIIPFSIYYSWILYANHIFNPSSINYSIANSIPVGSTFVSQSFTEDGILLFSKFFRAIFTETIMSHPINLSYFIIILSISVFLILFGVFCKEDKSFYAIPVFFFLGSIGYALGILLSYISIFSDGHSLPLYGRYMQTYTFFGFLLIFVLIYEKINSKKLMLALTIFSFNFVNLDSVDYIIYNKNREMYKSKERTGIGNWINNEYNYQNIIVVNQTDMVYFSLLKNLFGEKGMNVTYIQSVDSESKTSFINLLKENEFILIGDSDDRFNNLWNEITNIPPYNSTLYKISINENDIALEMVYTWDE